MSHAIQAVRGKVQIKETKTRAQLSILIQVVEEDYIPAESSLEKEILEIIKDSLRTHLRRASELKNFKQFTHVFVSILDNSQDERVFAVFTKTPSHPKPFLHIFDRNQVVAKGDSDQSDGNID
ncbi:MAG: hypothetical protein H3C47_05380 [Candidatus Cloacimonetes bacterium]|nr:hypothetical protein [Candidatus Cloacimonadota bacterium]